jgi:hypothetical protein
MRWLIGLLISVGFSSHIAVNMIPCVCTGQYDLARTGANTSETTLTQSNAGSLTKLGSYSVTGKPWAQPLYVPYVLVGGARHNALIVATSTNNVYLFDADSVGSAALWSLSLGTPYSSGDTNYYDGNIGITSTPVVDRTTNVLYFVSDNSSGAYSIHAVNLADGTDYHAAVNISGSVSGVTFTSTAHGQRPALLLLGSNVYVAFGSFADVGTWYGWIFAFDKTSLAKTQSFLTTPTANEASLWMAGGGLSSDGTNIWGVTGNDSSSCSPSNYSESFINLTPSLSVIDYMTPSNCPTLDSGDQDQGSSRALIAGNYILSGGKDGRFWILNKGAMGSNQGSGPPIAQVWQLSASKIYDGFVFANSRLFVTSGFRTTAEPIEAFSCPSTCNTTALWSSGSNYTYSTLAYSSNGSLSGTALLWAYTSTGNADTSEVAATFTVLNADTGSALYTDSSPGNLAKFNMVTVANGKAYLPVLSGSDGAVNVYGLP